MQAIRRRQRQDEEVAAGRELHAAGAVRVLDKDIAYVMDGVGYIGVIEDECPCEAGGTVCRHRIAVDIAREAVAVGSAA